MDDVFDEQDTGSAAPGTQDTGTEESGAVVT